MIKVLLKTFKLINKIFYQKLHPTIRNNLHKVINNNNQKKTFLKDIHIESLREQYLMKKIIN